MNTVASRKHVRTVAWIRRSASASTLAVACRAGTPHHARAPTTTSTHPGYTRAQEARRAAHLIHDKDLAVAKQRAREAQQLPLAHAKVRAALFHGSVQAQRQ